MKQVVPTAALVDANGKMRQLTSKREPDEEVTEEKVADPKYVVRLFMRILRELAAFRRRFAPRRIDYQDFPVGAATDHRFPHAFDGRVCWYVVDATGAHPSLLRSADTDTNTLVLTSATACTISLRIEEVG